MRIQKILAAAALLVAGLFSAAEAAPVTYTLSGTADGSVGATGFLGADFIWTFDGDSNDLLTLDSSHYILPFNSSSLDIAGFGVVTPSLQMGAVNNVIFPGALVLTDGTFSGGIAFGASSLLFYDGVTSLGPIPVFFDISAPLPSDKGDFVLFASTMTFQVVGVPEPVTLALFGVGLAGAGMLRRKRKTLV